MSSTDNNTNRVLESEFRRYVGGTLIPLNGKAPVDVDWRNVPYNTAKVIENAIKKNRNLGYRIPSGEVVIDVDPRNGGDESFVRLCLEFGLGATDFPTVETGSG